MTVFLFMLWFDVGKDRYTAKAEVTERVLALWFDVGKDRYTAIPGYPDYQRSCGLM